MGSSVKSVGGWESGKHQHSESSVEEILHVKGDQYASLQVMQVSQ